jgi:hypothetical protein
LIQCNIHSGEEYDDEDSVISNPAITAVDVLRLCAKYWGGLLEIIRSAWRNYAILVTSAQTRAFLKWTVAKMGAQKLGIQVSIVGTHSVRTSCAMLLYMAKVRMAAIMLLGRWKSDAFLLYLQCQVKEFTQGLSEAMASQPAMFHTHATNTEPITSNHINQATQDDPMTQNSNSLASSTTWFNGQSTTNTNGTRNNLVSMWYQIL